MAEPGRYHGWNKNSAQGQIHKNLAHVILSNGTTLQFMLHYVNILGIQKKADWQVHLEKSTAFHCQIRFMALSEHVCGVLRSPGPLPW